MSSTQVILMVFMGAVVMALQASARRKALKEQTISPLQFSITAFGGATILFSIIYVGMYGWKIPEVLDGFWRVVVAGSLVNVAIQYLNARAASYKDGEQSYTQPLQAMTPALITLTAVFLGEFPSTVGMVGVGCFMVSVYVMTSTVDPKKRWWSYFVPFHRIFSVFRPGQSVDEREKSIVTILALSSALFGTVGILMDGLYARRGVSLQGILLGAMVLTAILCLSYLVWYSIAPDGKDVPVVGRRSAMYFAGAYAVGWVIHVCLIWPPFLSSYVSYVGTLKRFSVPLGVLAGYIFFSERKDFRRRMFAAFLTIIGAVLIATDKIPAALSARIEGLGF